MIASRNADVGDQARMFMWRNGPQIAGSRYTDQCTGENEHANWLAAVLRDEKKNCAPVVSDVGVANVVEIDRRNSRCIWAFDLAASDIRGVAKVAGLSTWCCAKYARIASSKRFEVANG